ncbi:MAG: ammonium transporter [Bacteroidales bacterium]|nr:ammonium transporter [Bacteroidales bacterium]MDD4770712.1 ammonium transporter [Bacteroidales bacterium]
MKKRWIILMAILVIVSVLGVVLPEGAQWKPTPEVLAQLDKADMAWMITATIFVLMMTPGLSFFYCGMVRKKNVISTMLQSFIAMGVISVLWVVVGFSLAFGDDVGGLGIIGNPASFFMFRNVGLAPNEAFAATIPFALFALFQMKFAIITPSLITGSFAERVRFSSYMVFMALFCLFVYCPLAHCTWHPDGLFKDFFGTGVEIKDFAGGIVVHASSGVAALAGALFLGRRQNEAFDKPQGPANIPFVMLGAAMLWLGWFGFNAGSSLAADGVAVKAFLNTNTASATAMLVWVVFDSLRGRKPSAMGASIGAVVGLVAITPMAGYVSVGHSIAIAFIVTILCNIAVHWRGRSSIDDALDVFPTHGVGGIMGTVLTGIFVGVMIEGGDAKTAAMYLLAILLVIAYSFVVSLGLYWLTNKMIVMRVSEKSERIGLDLSQHDECYSFADGGERELAEYSEKES